jgi:hypothetical protein
MKLVENSSAGIGKEVGVDRDLMEKGKSRFHRRKSRAAPSPGPTRPLSRPTRPHSRRPVRVIGVEDVHGVHRPSQPPVRAEKVSKQRREESKKKSVDDSRKEEQLDPAVE